MATDSKPKLEPNDMPNYVPRWVLWVGLAVGAPFLGWMIDIELDQAVLEKRQTQAEKERDEIKQFLMERFVGDDLKRP